MADAGGMDAAEVLEYLASSESGLSATEAAYRLDSFGPNVVTSRRVTALGVLGGQLRNPLLLLLLVAAAVSGLTGYPTDALIIAAIVALSVGLGFVNEYRAQAAVAALQARIRHLAVVCRGGATQTVDTTSLVPGDVVTVRVGDLVPADIRLLEANDLECDEAVLTGESMPTAKTTAPQPDASGVKDRKSVV